MIRRFSLVRKRPEVSREEFFDRWTGEHVEIAKRLAGLRGYVIHILDGPAPPYDGIAVTTFDSREDAERAFGDPELAEGLARTRDDFAASVEVFLHLDGLAVAAGDELKSLRVLPLIFHTISVSDGIPMGTEGMRASLPSRDWIADSVELVVHAERMDGLLTIAGCDKTLPGMMMAMIRLDLPSVFAYGGSIRPGCFRGEDVTIQDVYEGIGAHSTGKMSLEDLTELECVALPGKGSCASMYTAKAMASVAEALGLTVPGMASPATVDPAREQIVRRAAAALVDALESDRRPSTILTKASFENAIAVAAALHTVADPVKQTGGYVVLWGNLAPDGAVIKVANQTANRHRGPAKVFDGEQDAFRAVSDGRIRSGDVVVLRYEGPKGGPGMPEMTHLTSAIVGAGLVQEVALLTDDRFGGGTQGISVGHISPEAAAGGPLAILRDGDVVEIDAEANRLHVDLPDGEIAARLAAVEHPPPRYPKGVLAKYARLVGSAATGARVGA